MASPQDKGGKVILVSGINGYIASQIGYDLLQAGFDLRGTARNKASTDNLLAGPYKQFKNCVQIFTVPDITKPGAFDEAVEGVIAIIHTASPISASNLTWDATVTPAIAGCTSILGSALNKAGPQLISFVMTSSFSAAYDPSKKSHVFTGEDWNNWSAQKCEELGDKAPPELLYAESKAAAEKAVWKFRDEEKPPFAISTILPGTVMGRRLIHPSEPSSLNLTLKPVYSLFSGETNSIPPPIGPTYVSLQDTSLVHLYVATHPAEAGDTRYLLAAGRAGPQAIADILRRAYPDRSSIIPKGTPGKGYGKEYGWDDENGERVFSVDCGGAQQILGRELSGFEEIVLDTVRGFQEAWG